MINMETITKIKMGTNEILEAPHSNISNIDLCLFSLDDYRR